MLPENLRFFIKKVRKDRTTRYFSNLLLFILLYKTGQYLFEWMASADMFQQAIAGLYDALSALVTRVTTWFYALFFAVTVQPGYIICIDGVQTIRMENGCTGLMQIFQVLFILVFFPVSARHKLWLAPAALIIMVLASLIHYIILVPAAWYAPAHFVLFHDIISRVIFYCIFFVNFVLWNRTAEKNRTTTEP